MSTKAGQIQSYLPQCRAVRQFYLELKAHFSNIHKVIIGHLEDAQSEIMAAIAWFTDREIFNVICKRARSGIKVSVALIGDEINQGPGGLNFHSLKNFGGQVIFLPPGSRDEPTMHHKFCVIDRSTVITGSYNWSHKARSNDENITVVTDSGDFAGKYLDTFDSLVRRTGHDVRVVPDVDAARRRMEMIRNLILLGEQDEIAAQLRKLRPVAEILHVSRIIAALDGGEYRTALAEIEAYLCRATALVVTGYAEIPRLRFQLQSLELRLESLSEEKTDLERRLILFNRRHNEVLGDLIQRILKARAELARLRATEMVSPEQREEVREAARHAEEAYEDYSKKYEDMKHARPLPKLTEAAERELKSLYRKACSLCHPDKVSGEWKEAAHRVFVELQEVYKWNDLARVREIHQALIAGGLPGTRSSRLDEVDALKAAVTELEYEITRLVAELKAFHESEGIRLLGRAGTTEADWEKFIERRLQTFESELAKLEADLVKARGRKSDSLDRTRA